MPHKPGWDAKVIPKVTKRQFDGSYEAMFRHRDWPERGSTMMQKVQSRVAETHGSVRNFADHFESRLC